MGTFDNDPGIRPTGASTSPTPPPGNHSQMTACEGSPRAVTHPATIRSGRPHNARRNHPLRRDLSGTRDLLCRFAGTHAPLPPRSRSRVADRWGG
jgi:hypothetical protein